MAFKLCEQVTDEVDGFIGLHYRSRALSDSIVTSKPVIVSTEDCSHRLSERKGLQKSPDGCIGSPTGARLHSSEDATPSLHAHSIAHHPHSSVA